jgi:hypothetical protein
VPWESAAATVAIGLVVVGASAALLARRRRTAQRPAPSPRGRLPAEPPPVDPELAAVLERRTVRRGRPQPDLGDEESVAR